MPESSAMPTDLKRVVLAQGAYTLSRGHYPIRHGRQAIEDAARACFPDKDMEVVSIGGFIDFPELFEPTVEHANRHGLMKLAGAASGQFIQGAWRVNE
jgi:hypothetical protein